MQPSVQHRVEAAPEAQAPSLPARRDGTRRSRKALLAGRFPVTRLRRDAVAFLGELKDARGDVARVPFGRRHLVLVSDPGDIHFVLVDPRRRFRRGDRPLYKSWRGPQRKRPGELAFEPRTEPDFHFRARRTLQPTFARARIDSHWPRFVAVARGRIASLEPGVRDAVGDLHSLAIELAADAVFAGRTPLPLPDAISRKDACLTLSRNATSFLYRLVDAAKVRQRLNAIAAHDALLDAMARELESRRTSSNGSDALHQLLELGASDVVPDDRIVAEAVGLFLTMNYGGIGATTWALHYLARNEDALRRLRAEADPVFADGLETSSATAPGEYTLAVVNEALRLHPTGAFIVRECQTECVLGDEHIRPGDLVLVCPFLVHRDDRWWPDPDVFDPSRWKDRSDGRERLTFIPFGAGAHRCVGLHVATNVIAASIAAFASIWDFAVEEAPPSPTAANPASFAVRLLERRL